LSITHPDDLFHRLGDPLRMRALAGYDLCTPGLAVHLDPICGETAARLGAPVSLISIILDRTQLIVGSHGLDGWVDQMQEVPAEWAICTHTVLAGAPYRVADALTDPQHMDNPLLAATGLRSYVGVPLLDPDGQALGSICVLDFTPRTPADQDLEILQAGAQRAMAILAA
jgi:GAF domain-containing protein